MADPKEIISSAQQAAVEADTLLGKCDQTRARIKDAAGTMLQDYDAAIERTHQELIARGIGNAPDLEERLARLLRSRNACARVHGESQARE